MLIVQTALAPLPVPVCVRVARCLVRFIFFGIFAYHALEKSTKKSHKFLFLLIVIVIIVINRLYQILVDS